jgi:hypothetical protein
VAVTTGHAEQAESLLHIGKALAFVANNAAAPSTAIALAFMTLEPARVLFKRVKLAAINMILASCWGNLCCFVCIFNIASAYCCLMAAKRLLVANVATAIAQWIKSFGRALSKVSWSNNCSGRLVRHCHLVVLLRKHDVVHGTANVFTVGSGSSRSIEAYLLQGNYADKSAAVFNLSCQCSRITALATANMVLVIDGGSIYVQEFQRMALA